MARLAQTAGLTDIQTEILRTVRDFVDKEIIPHAHRPRAQGRVPRGDRRGHEGDGPVRAHDPRGVRRARRVPPHLCADGRGDRARLDERLRRHQHALHRRVHADAPRHRGAEAAAAAEDGHRRGPRRLLDERAALRQRRVAAIRSKAVRDGEEYVLDGQKMWLTNGARSGLVATLVRKTDEGSRLGLPEHDDVPASRRSPASARPGRASPSRARSTRWATRASRPPR